MRLCGSPLAALECDGCVADEGSRSRDLRTWHGTVLAAAAAVDADPPVNNTIIKNGWNPL